MLTGRLPIDGATDTEVLGNIEDKSANLSFLDTKCHITPMAIDFVKLTLSSDP